MTRLEGKKPNTGAIIIAAVIFALVAGGLFFAFRGVPEPTDAGLSNSANPSQDSANSADGNSAADGESSNSLTTILTPLPEATPTANAAAPDANASASAETPATSEMGNAPNATDANATDANATDANATASDQAMANGSAPAATNSVTPTAAP